MGHPTQTPSPIMQPTSCGHLQCDLHVSKLAEQAAGCLGQSPCHLPPLRRHQRDACPRLAPRRRSVRSTGLDGRPQHGVQVGTHGTGLTLQPQACKVAAQRASGGSGAAGRGAHSQRR